MVLYSARVGTLFFFFERIFISQYPNIDESEQAVENGDLEF